MENSVINVLVIGWGTSAKVFHVPLITSLPNYFKITHVLERSSNNCLKTLPDVKIVRSLDEFYSNYTAKLAVVTTPNSTHYSIAKDLLEHQINVVIEKPFVVNSNEANELCQIAKKNGVFITVYHNRRWDGDFLTVKDLIKNNTLGRIVEFESHFDRYRNYTKNGWKEKDIPGSGLVYDLGSHLIDQALCLFGDPTSVYARIMNQRKIAGNNSVDSFEIHLNYDEEGKENSSSIVILKAGMLVKENNRIRYAIHGTEGSYFKYNLDVQEDQLRAGMTPLKNEAEFGIEKDEESWGIINTTLPPEHKLEISGKVKTINGNYIEFYKNVAQVIQQNNQNILNVKPEEAAKVIKIIELAYQSNKEHQNIKFN